ncbi:MAG: hypothetical protein ACRDZ5_08995, partial [Acidimicrobiales bacterium]
MEPVRFARSARQHRVGKAHALHVIDTSPPTDVPAVGDFDARRVWRGPDDRGLELEIVAIILPSELLVIHVMPTALEGLSPQGCCPRVNSAGGSSRPARDWRRDARPLHQRIHPR